MARRQFRPRDSYRRKGPTREPYASVLIVCEGGKTEPNYFEGLRAAHNLGSANVKVRPMGCDPLSIVDYAIAELEKDDALDVAYCVFDQDEHATFDAAKRKARDHEFGRSRKLRLAVSIPCFEVWPLLHFNYSTRSIVAGGGKTPGQRALADLLEVMPSYSKTDRGIYEKLSDRLDRAIQHACRLVRYNGETGSDNPSTDVHILVEYLRRLKE